MDRLSSNVEAEDNSLRFVLMEERREEAEQVARDTVLLAESFQDVAQMVKEQGVMLDQMEAATKATLNNTSGGKEHLRRASESKRFWVGAISAVAGTLILTAFCLAALGRMTRKELDK